MNIIGTLILSPGAQIVACDAGALTVFRCAPRDLLLRPVTEFLPDLPLQERSPSANIRYANQCGDLLSWRSCSGLAPNGRSIQMDILVSRCGYRPAAALWLFLRRLPDLLECSGRQPAHSERQASIRPVEPAAAASLVA